MDKLLDLRDKIQSIDYGILVLIERRLALRRSIDKTKKMLGHPVIDHIQKEKVFSNIYEKADQMSIDVRFSIELFELLVNESIRLQMSDVDFAKYDIAREKLQILAENIDLV